jgi:RND superfamily putative drug exporter
MDRHLHRLDQLRPGRAVQGGGAWLETVVGSLGALILLLIPFFRIKVGQDSLASLDQTGPPHSPLVGLTSAGISTGALTPLGILVSTAGAPVAEARLSKAPGIATVMHGRSRGDLTDLIAFPNTASLNNTTLPPVRSVESALAGRPELMGVTDPGSSLQHFSTTIYGNFPLMFAVIVLLMLVLLPTAFRSVVLAVKAMSLNVLSLDATFGCVAWFWQEGHGSNALFSIRASGAITLCLLLAFASLASAPVTDLKVIATGLGVGILLDPPVVRARLVPSLVALLGRWNWWMPGRFVAWSGRRIVAESELAGAAT